MKKTILILIVLCFFVAAGQAQNDSIAKNSVFVELGGTGGYYSFKYDRILIRTDKLTFSGTVGFTPFTSTQINDDTYWDFFPRIPLSLNAMTGKKNHHFKFGVAYTPFYYDDSKYLDMTIQPPWVYPTKKWDHLFSLVIGYRFQKINNGFFLNVDFTPLHYNQGFGFFTWAGIGIGYSF